jgi:hypothetical protein
MQFLLWLALEVSVAASIAVRSPVPTPMPTPIPTPAAATNCDSPCASVSSLWAAAQPSSSTVPADIAYECLQSVPVDVPGDLKLIEELKLFLQWQSNLAYQKLPPPGAPQPPIDMIVRLDEISFKLATGGHYSSEYEVQLDINAIFMEAHDGHLGFTSDILTVINFSREATLISISIDGFILPQLYLFRKSPTPMLS